MKRKTTVPNAQLAAWLGCVPSTVHIWRVKKTLSTKGLTRISKKIGRLPITKVLQLHKSRELMSLIEAKYKEEGEPFKHISGRDFWDTTRKNYPEVQEILSHG